MTAARLEPATERQRLMLEIDSAHPSTKEWAVSDGARPSGHATDPPPRAFMVARTERSPGFGTPLAFPVSQWRSEWRAWPTGPGTRYSGGAAPVLHRLPSSPVRVASVFPQRLVYDAVRPPQGHASSSALSRARSARYDAHSAAEISASFPAYLSSSAASASTSWSGDREARDPARGRRAYHPAPTRAAEQ